jgi:hypothetical protein
LAPLETIQKFDLPFKTDYFFLIQWFPNSGLHENPIPNHGPRDENDCLWWKTMLYFLFGDKGSPTLHIYNKGVLGKKYLGTIVLMYA